MLAGEFPSNATQTVAQVPRRHATFQIIHARNSSAQPSGRIRSKDISRTCHSVLQRGLSSNPYRTTNGTYWTIRAQEVARELLAKDAQAGLKAVGRG